MRLNALLIKVFVSLSQICAFFSLYCGQGCGRPADFPVHKESDFISDGMPVNHRTPCTHVHALIHVYGQFSIASLTTCLFLDSMWNLERAEETHANTGRTFIAQD